MKFRSSIINLCRLKSMARHTTGRHQNTVAARLVDLTGERCQTEQYLSKTIFPMLGLEYDCLRTLPHNLCEAEKHIRGVRERAI